MDGGCCNGCDEDETGSKWIFHSVSKVICSVGMLIWFFGFDDDVCDFVLEYQNFEKQDEIVRDVTGEVPFLPIVF